MLTELTEEIEKAAQSVVDDLHTLLPAKIKRFDPESCTADVVPYGRYLTADDEEVEYPMVANAPVMFPWNAAANAGMLIPVKEGDDCMVLFSEIELDEWLSGAQSDAPMRFDQSSAVVIPGLLKQGNTLIQQASENDSVIVSAGSTKMTVSDDMVQIDGSVYINGDLISGGGSSTDGFVKKSEISIATSAMIDTLTGGVTASE